MDDVRQPTGDTPLDRDDDDDRSLLLPLGVPDLLGDASPRHIGDDDRLLLEGCVDTGPFSPLDDRPFPPGDMPLLLRLLPLDDMPFPRLSPISWRVPLPLPPGAPVITLGLVPVRTDGL